MRWHSRINTHLRWRALQAQRAYRGRLFDMAGHYRAVVRTTDHHGNRFLVSTADQDIGRAVFVNGGFEVSKISNVLAVLSDHGTTVTRILDVGANIGTTTIELLTQLPDATAECFEPEPFNHRLLVRNIADNGLGSRTRLHQLALSDTDASLQFEISAKNAGDHRVRVSDLPGAFDEASRTTITVPARRLDDLGIPTDAQTLACIDVQGHELQVLIGALSLSGPVTVEFWPYALQRAGTLSRLVEHVAGRGRVLDISDDPVIELDRLALATIAMNLDPHHIRELLILPA